MRTIIAGLRNYNNKDTVIEAIKLSGFGITEVVCGEAKGVDQLGKLWGIENKIPIKSFHAEWNSYGKSAGPIRNKKMAKYADACIAVWDGKSLGTQNMILQANHYGLKVFIYRLDKNGN